MKKILSLLLLCTAFAAKSQLLSWSPDFIKETTVNNSITMDANFGNKALLNYASNVYVHIGVITSLSTSSADWKYVKFTWATSDVNALCTSLGSSKWRFTIAPNLRTFFGITNSAETIKKISILFRTADGNTVQRNADASDMYIPVYDDGVYAMFRLIELLVKSKKSLTELLKVFPAKVTSPEFRLAPALRPALPAP